MSKDFEKGSPNGTAPTTSVSPLESKKHAKTVPNYLRATRGSCHDFCKYGHKNPSEEEPGFSGGRRKKLPAHLNNLTLHRSAILDRSKDVKNRSVSLAKSSISLGEAEQFAPKKASANRKGVPSSEHMVPRTATPSQHKSLNSDGRKMHSIVAQKAPTNLRCSNGVPKKETMPAKGAIFPAKSKFPEKTFLEKSRNVDRVTMANQSLQKRPASSPTKLNMVKQGPVASQASSKHLLSKHKNTPEGPVAANITRMHAKAGKNPKRSSNSNINGKEGSDMPRSSLSLEPKLTASVEIQIDDPQITGYYIDSTLAELSAPITEYVDNSQPAPEETSKSISEDDGVGRTEKSEVLGGEALLESTIALELQQSLDGKEFSAILGESDLEHNLPEHNIVHNQASRDYDSQTDYAALCQLPEQVTAVENADVYDFISTQSNSKIEDDQVEVNASVESLISEGKEEMGVHQDFERSPGLLVLDKKHNEEPESCLDLASGNSAENDTAGKVFDSRMNSSASHCQSISETSSDGGLLEEPKSMLIEPSVFAGDELASISNENTSEQAGLKSRIFIPHQSPEELSDDEFYEEYDFELSESDESGTENEETTINKNRDDSLKSGGQRSRRTSALELDDASLTPYKLKFKRGKIVELPPDSIGPRRLKFRRKSANEASNRESQPARRIYRRNSTSNAVPTDVESPGVKLRHQDAQEKKDAQGLFNNVIEETASKLVESRKSKVKALVGAFETVISLQDGKPTSSTAQAGNSQDSIPDGEGNAPEETE